MERERYLIPLLNRLVALLGWGTSKEWTNSDYQALSLRIYTKTQVSINARTLRRIFDILEGSDYSPYISTKNALAQFLDYKDWDDYRQAFTPAPSDIKSPNAEYGSESSEYVAGSIKNKSKLKTKVLKLAGGLCVLAVAVFIIYRYVDTDEDPIFSAKVPSSAGFPFTFSVIADKVIKEESGYRLNTFNGFKQKSRPFKGKMDNITYFLPGIYRIQITKTGSKNPIFNYTLHIPTDGWQSAVGYNSQHANPSEYTLDIPEKNGLLYLSPERVRKYKEFDEDMLYWVHYRNFFKTGISGDDLIFESKIINNDSLGGVTCYDAIIYLRGDKNDLRIQLINKGCHRFVELWAGNSQINGGSADLSMFGSNIEKGVLLKLITHNNKAEYHLNNKKIYEFDYKGECGEILGIEHVFKGHGGVDYYSLKSGNENIKYEEDF